MSSIRFSLPLTTSHFHRPFFPQQHPSISIDRRPLVVARHGTTFAYSVVFAIFKAFADTPLMLGSNYENGPFLPGPKVAAPAQAQGGACSDGISLEGEDVSLNFERGSENQVKGAHVNMNGEQPGNGFALDGVDVSLRFEHASANQVEGAQLSVEGAHRGDGISMLGKDVSLICEHLPENRVGGPQVSLKDGVSVEGDDSSLKFEYKSENKVEEAHESVQDEQPGDGISSEGANEGHGLNEKGDSLTVPDCVEGDQNVETKDDVFNSSQMDGVRISQVEQVEKLQSENCGKFEENEHDPCGTQASPVVIATPSPGKTGEKGRVLVLGLPVTSELPRHVRRPVKAAAMSAKHTRAMRCRSKENSIDPEPDVSLENTKNSTGKRGRKKGKEKDGKSDDEFSKMKKHLRYQLHRIRYEQSLLDAYSSEGWRGQSVEKLRPEKELERAKADINRYKLKIRNLFQKLDSMSAEGKYPESLYDSEGLIDSEDIYCAKCGLKDLLVGNDIILCDGICERGFHQNCLVPPLRTEEIPPGDEGWLCPACDCKHDCVDLINEYNDSQGAKVAIDDSWEKVFPEAVAATASKELDDLMGLPSDDSEDDEYNPDGREAAAADADVERNESTAEEADSNESDSSEFSSASEDLGAIGGDEQNLGLPSDDSEDNDYDPDAKTVNEEGVEHESSSSDFTSASEDLGGAISDDASDKDEPILPMEMEQDFGESSALTSKRCVERLDYKKLYDESYGNAASDSSDDEEWTDMVATRKRKSSTEKSASASSLGASAFADNACGSGAPRKRGRPKAKLQAANGSPAQVQDSSQKTSSGGSDRKRPPYNKLGEAVTQRLLAFFKENKYPDRQEKEKLANELGLTVYKVDKWFGNARWSFNHCPSRIESAMSRAVSLSNGGESGLASEAAAVPERDSAADTSKLDTTSPGSTHRNSRKNNTEGDKPTTETTNTENLKEVTQTDTLRNPDASQGRVQRKRRKSGA